MILSGEYRYATLVPLAVMGDKTLHVRITQATDVLWEGEALSVSSENVDGPFDVLPLHANFVTLLKDVPIYST